MGYNVETEEGTVMASKKGRANNHKNKRKITAGIRGEIRRQHFEAGGTLAGWRGTTSVQKNKNEKRNDRSTVRRKAIRESLED